MPETKKKQNATSTPKKKTTAKKKPAAKTKKSVKKAKATATKTIKKNLSPPMTEQELLEREEEALVESLAENINADEGLAAHSNDATDEQEPAQEDYGLIPVLIVAALIAFCFRIFIFQPFNIPSGSMYPNLLVGDYLFVSKYSYGYSRYSFPDWLFVDFDGRVMDTPPARGDVVVFRQPKELYVDYIKRIIGLPGDKIQMREGILYINNKVVPREFLNVEERVEEGQNEVYSKYEETLPNGVKHFIYEKSDWEFYDDTREYEVPEGHYFVMGDNRDGSLDSRATDKLGPIPEDNLIGKARVLFFSTEGIGDSCLLDDSFFRYPKNLACMMWHGTKSIRYSRLFKIIH